LKAAGGTAVECDDIQSARAIHPATAHLASVFESGVVRWSRAGDGDVGGVPGGNQGESGGSMVSVRFGAFAFHADRRQLLRHGADVHLTPKAFDLLALLIERAPAVISKADIHKRLWPGTFVSDATLVGLVKELRRALGDHRGALIRTAHSVGYAFTGPMSAGESVQDAAAVRHWLVAGTRRIPLHDGVNVIGRDPEATVWIDVAGVSRRHAQITLEDGIATIEDLGSKNGTLVGDQPVRGRVGLRDADRIQLATELLVFRASGTGVSTATQPVLPDASRSRE
jgi:DNA-binding winged helix-turn-helix (wHTH) protein